MTEAEFIPRRDDFRVAIICAVGVEGDAVEKQFEKKWRTEKLGRHPLDTNAYSVGQIGTSLVVLVWLSDYGKTKAATAAVRLHYSFSNIKHALVVGICGGVPAPVGMQEIVLGDVVISTKLQLYDQGKQFDESYVTTEATRPHKDMGAFLKKLQASGDSQHRLKEYLAARFRIAQSRDERYAIRTRYPGDSKDILFHPKHIHKHYSPSDCRQCAHNEGTCLRALSLACADLNCNGVTARAIPRHQRASESTEASPSIHFGTVASGDTVMKSAVHRDEIAKKEGVIAFEMEAAGVCDEIQSIVVIKGVCDYADSHKNKIWQAYAAAVAAACAGAFLELKEEEFGSNTFTWQIHNARTAPIDSGLASMINASPKSPDSGNITPTDLIPTQQKISRPPDSFSWSYSKFCEDVAREVSGHQYGPASGFPQHDGRSHWYCCQCHGGPFNAELYPQCAECNSHARCVYCVIEMQKSPQGKRNLGT